MNELKESGYTVISSIYTPEETVRLRTSIVKEVLELIFNERGISIPLNEESLLLLTSPQLRSQTLTNPKIIWRDNNPRTPILSKSCGIMDIHYNLDVLDLITLNSRLYQLLSSIYEDNKLVHKLGPERIGIKPTDSTDMDKHIDANLFYPEVNHLKRFQSLVCISIDSNFSFEKNGTLCVLANFHWYWDFASALFHPHNGAFPFPDNHNRYFLLPKDFDSKYLPILKTWIIGYTNYLYHQIKGDTINQQWYEKFELKGIKVPHQVKEIKWTPVKCKAGDVIVWSQYLPHRNLRNKSRIPRIVAYYSVFPIDKDWYTTQEAQKCRTMFKEGSFYENKTISSNIEEITHIHKHNLLSVIEKMYKKDEFTQKITGFLSWI